MRLINLTPHAVVIHTAAGDTISIPPTGQVARCAETSETVATIEIGGHAVPVNRTVFGAVENLPAPAEGIGYIVSALVAGAVPARADVFGVAQPVRDAEGRVIGCRALSVR